jgi:hypothetical protein
MLSRKTVKEEAEAELNDAGKVDRRRDVRHLTILRVGTILIGERRELCLIRNISAGGLMALVYSRLVAGDRIAIELKTNQQIPGKISWVRDSTVGIEFDERIDVAEVLSNATLLDNGWRPRMPRVPVEKMATLRAGARTYWVTVQDVSQGGVKIEADQPLEVNGEAVVTLENFRPVTGVVRWRRGNLAGISFNQVIPFHELSRWLTHPAA